MKFYHKGVKTSNETGFASGCFVLIGIAAIIFLITLLDDIEDLKEYFFELIFAGIVCVGFLFTVFAKKGKLSNFHASIENNYFSMEKINIPIQNITIDVYYRNENFIRYHLRDSIGEIAIFSVFKDDLLAHFEQNLPNQVKKHEESSSKHDGPYISVLGSQTLYYDLNTGKYTIDNNKQTEISFLPKVYTYDPKYKLGKPLFKQK